MTTRTGSAAETLPPEASYEELTAMLTAIVERMEESDLTLDEALEAYERGVALVQRCNELLDNAELRISELSAGLLRGEASGSAEFRRASLFDPDDELEDEE